MSYNDQGIELVDFYCEQCNVHFSLQASAAQSTDAVGCPFHYGPEHVRKEGE